MPGRVSRPLTASHPAAYKGRVKPHPPFHPAAWPAPVHRFRSLFAAVALVTLALAALPVAATHAQAPNFNTLFVFGDSLSDTGDRADRSVAQYNLRFPAPFFNYTLNRYTSGPDTRPPSLTFRGVWHEQLRTNFLKFRKAKPSLEGGTSYAFGDGRTSQGTHENVIPNISPLVGTTYSVTIDDMGKQVNDYLSNAGGQADPAALYVLWGGNNDLASVDPSAAGVATAVGNEVGLVRQLALAGARRFLLVNVPPLGSTPVVAARGPAVAAGLNQLTAGFRGGLAQGIGQLQAGLSAAAGISLDVRIVDSFAILQDAIATPAAYGFSSVTVAAQASPNPARDDADRYLFWDGFHPTAAGHYQLAAEAFGVLSGVSVVQVYGDGTNFYFTRTGENLGADLTVNFGFTGKETGNVTIPAGARHVAVPVSGGKRRLSLQNGDGYVVGVHGVVAGR